MKSSKKMMTILLAILCIAAVALIARHDGIAQILARNYFPQDTARAAAMPQKATVAKPPQGFAGVLTWHNDNLRDGLNSQETILTPANVSAANGFGVVFSYPVDGYIFGQPLYVPNVNVVGYGMKNVVYVATENDSLYAFDADGVVTTPLWQASFINPPGVVPIPETLVNCPQAGPGYGVTATPVIDPVAGVIYVLAAIYIPQPSGKTSYILHALDITSGQEEPYSPVVVKASVGSVTLSAVQELSRTGLLLADGNVYMAFGSYCDHPPYNGFVVAYNASTFKQAAVFTPSPTGSDSGIWMSGDGIGADSAGYLYFSTGNGTFDVNTGGSNYGDSFLKMNPNLTVADYFTPAEQQSDDENNEDMGAGGFLLMAPQTPVALPEIVSGSKDGTLYVMNKNYLSHYNSTKDNIVQEIPDAFAEGFWSGFAYWNNNVYAASNTEYLTQYPVVRGLLTTPIVANNSELAYPYPGATPSVSSNGTSNAIVWTLFNDKQYVRLHASMATNVASPSLGLYDSVSTSNATGVKFVPPTIANGRVYVSTQTALVVFGLTN